MATQAASSLPSLAFGALKWEQYFGLKVTEPALPPDIDTILASACPFFPGKKVAETHFLTLVPENMTLERLEAPIQDLQQGNKIGFQYKSDAVWVEHSKTVSGRAHWVLMTNDVIPGSRSKTWEDQQTFAFRYELQGYKLLSVVDATTAIFTEYVQAGKRFYSDTPWTHTRCVELVFSQWPVVIGAFGPGGARVNLSHVGAYEINGLGLARKFH